ncbi:MAG: 50S ribosomal protein L29 [Alphaproteobacteria bacterium]|nr:50S ribosomal protein L29 [Alphaproteobacteria bacterium]
MKDKLEINKLKDASTADIYARVVELTRSLMNFRFARSAGNLKDTSQIRKTKKAIAKLNTFATKNSKKKETK